MQLLIQNLPDLTLQEWQRVVDIVQKLFTILAIVVGGIWAYFNFFKSRTFRARLDLGLSGVKALNDAGGMRLLATTTLTNKGLTDVDIEQVGSGLVVSLGGNFASSASMETHVVSGEWKDVTAVSVFKPHKWIEPNETIAEQHLIFVPRADLQVADAIQLRLRIVSKRRFRSNIAWVAVDTVVLENTDRSGKEPRYGQSEDAGAGRSVGNKNDRTPQTS